MQNSISIHAGNVGTLFPIIISTLLAKLESYSSTSFGNVGTYSNTLEFVYFDQKVVEPVQFIIVMPV